MSGLLVRLSALVPQEDRVFIRENIGSLANYSPPTLIFNRLEEIYLKYLNASGPNGYSRSCTSCINTMKRTLEFALNQWRAEEG